MLRTTYKNHVWSYDSVADPTHDGMVKRILNIIDEFTREYLAIRCEWKILAIDMIGTLTRTFLHTERLSISV